MNLYHNRFVYAYKLSILFLPLFDILLLVLETSLSVIFLFYFYAYLWVGYLRCYYLKIVFNWHIEVEGDIFVFIN